MTQILANVTPSFIAAGVMYMKEKPWLEAVNNLPFMNLLINKARIKPYPYTSEFFVPITPPSSTTATWTGDDGVGMTVDDSNALEAAQFPIKTLPYAKTIKIDSMFLEKTGPAKIDWWVSQIHQASVQVLNTIEPSLFSDGTANAGNIIGGLALAISKTPTVGVYGGIDRATNPAWRNQAFDASVVNSAIPVFNGLPTNITNILPRFRAVLQQMRLNGQNIDCILCSSDYYTLLQEAMQTFQRQIIEYPSVQGRAASKPNWLKTAGAYLELDYCYVINGNSGIVTADTGYVGMLPKTAYFLNIDTITFGYIRVPAWQMLDMDRLKEMGVDEKDGMPNLGFNTKDGMSSEQMSDDLWGLITIPFQDFNSGLIRTAANLNPTMQFVTKCNLIVEQPRQNAVYFDA
jgi:hypothetical protein